MFVFAISAGVHAPELLLFYTDSRATLSNELAMTTYERVSSKPIFCSLASVMGGYFARSSKSTSAPPVGHLFSAKTCREYATG